MAVTPSMIKYAEELIEKCGYSQHDYDIDNMEYNEVVVLIDDLKEELGLDEEWGGQNARRWD